MLNIINACFLLSYLRQKWQQLMSSLDAAHAQTHLHINTHAYLHVTLTHKRRRALACQRVNDKWLLVNHNFRSYTHSYQRYSVYSKALLVKHGHKCSRTYIHLSMYTYVCIQWILLVIALMCVGDEGLQRLAVKVFAHFVIRLVFTKTEMTERVCLIVIA